MKKSDEIFYGNIKVFTNMIFIAGACTAILAGIVNAGQGKPIYVAINFTRGFIGVFLYLYALKTQNYRFGYISQLITLVVGMTAISIADGGIISPNTFFLVLLAPLPFLTGMRKLGIAFTWSITFILPLLWWTNYIGINSESHISPLKRLIMLELAMFIFFVACTALTRYLALIFNELDEEHETYKKAAVQKHKFFVHINHELRNPVTAILSAVSLLKRIDSDIRSNEQETAQQRAQVISSLQSTCDHLLVVINDVLDFERLSAKSAVASGEYTDFNPRDIAQNVINILSIKAQEKSIKISYKVEIGVHKIYHGLSNKIQQVLINLVSNALQHSNGDVVILIRSHGDNLIYEVSDSGRGISKEDQEKLFEPFSSGFGFRGTSGLGLSICKTLVTEVMHGNIEVKSEVNKGTTFVITLPLKPSSVEYEASNTTQIVESRERNSERERFESLKGNKVLFVEDDEANNLMTSMLLSRYGLAVFSAHDSDEALQLLQSSGPFDAAIIDNDLGMGSPLNGVKLSAQLRTNGLKNIIGFTGNYSTDLVSSWRNAGVNTVLLKPADIEKILHAIYETKKFTDKSA